MRDAHLIDPCHRRATNYSAVISFVLIVAAAYLLLARDGGAI
jgi:hypothetical protein